MPPLFFREAPDGPGVKIFFFFTVEADMVGALVAVRETVALDVPRETSDATTGRCRRITSQFNRLRDFRTTDALGQREAADIAGVPV